MVSARHQSDTVVKRGAPPLGSGNWFFCKSQRLGCERGRELGGMGREGIGVLRQIGGKANVFKWVHKCWASFRPSSKKKGKKSPRNQGAPAPRAFERKPSSNRMYTPLSQQTFSRKKSTGGNNELQQELHSTFYSAIVNVGTSGFTCAFPAAPS